MINLKLKDSLTVTKRNRGVVSLSLPPFSHWIFLPSLMQETCNRIIDDVERSLYIFISVTFQLNIHHKSLSYSIARDKLAIQLNDNDSYIQMINV